MTPEIRAKIGRPGAANGNYRGGWRDRLGYVHIGDRLRSHVAWNDAHPNDPIVPGEVIHHLNHVKDDDRVENLMKLPRQADHARGHFAGIPKTAEHIANQAAAQRATTDKRRPLRPCEHCGALLSRQQMAYARRFCSQACHYAFRKGKGRTGW